VIFFLAESNYFPRLYNSLKILTENRCTRAQALVSFKKYMPPPFPYFKVNICPFPLPHFASIIFAYLWSFRWPNYIVTLPRYFSFRRWTYFYNLHWNNYLYFKDLLYIWEEMIMMALLHMTGLENSECIWKIHRKPEVVVSVSLTEIWFLKHLFF
jgi:hypothetical protein